MPNAMWLFVPSASPQSTYVVQRSSSGDPAQTLVLGQSIIMAGLHADRPSPGPSYTGCLYVETDTGGGTLSRCDGLSGAQVAAAIHPGELKVAQDFALEGALSPAQLTGDQNDYNPTGLAAAAVLRLSSDATRAITGLAGGAGGRVMLVENVGAHEVILRDQSGFSLTENQFLLPDDLTLGPTQGCLLWYDGTEDAVGWRLVASSDGIMPGAPTNAPYVTAAADPSLTMEWVLGDAVIMAGTHAARPAAGVSGRLYLETDTNGGT